MRISDWSSDVCSSDLGPGTCAERWIGIFKDEVLDEQDLISSKGIVAINAAIDHLLEIATDVGMGTTRGVFCPQDRAFLHANVAIPAGMMRDQALQRGHFRSEERRVGKECVSPCRSRWSPSHKKK